MRHALLAATALLFLGSAHAQFIEVADQRRPDVVYDKIIDLGDRFAIGAWQNRESESSGGPGNFVSIVGYDGVQIASVPVPMRFLEAWGWSASSAMIASPFGGFYVAGYEYQCDTQEPARVIHIDPNGVVLFDRPTPQVSQEFGYEYLAEEPVDFLAFIRNDEIAITDLLGDPITNWPNPNPSTSQAPTFARWLPTGDLLLVAVDRMRVVDINGSTLFQVQLSGTIQDSRIYQDDVLVLTSDSVHRLSMELEPMDIQPFAGQGSVARFLVSDEVFFQVGSQLWQWTEDGTSQVLVPSLLEGQRVRSMAIRNDTLFVSGTDHAHTFSSGLLRSYALDGSTSSHDLDAALESVVADTSWLEVTSFNTPAHGRIMADLLVTIRNNGQDPIDSLLLTFRVSLGWAYCGEPATRIVVPDLPLLPGASMTFRSDSLLLSNSYFTLPFDIVNDICVVVQNPNGHVDRNHSNDQACVTLTTPLSVNENQRSPLTIFPNPFTDQLTIRSSTSGPLTIRMFDATGRVVLTERISNGAILALPELAFGSYTIEATDGVLQWRRSLVKMDL